MFCNKCSEKIPDGSLFCPKCGQKVETGEVNDRVQKGKEILANWGAVHTIEDYELALEAMGYHSEGDICITGKNVNNSLHEICVINEREDYLVIIPCDDDAKPIFDWVEIIPRDEINLIEVKGLIDYIVVIYRNDEERLAIKIPGGFKCREDKKLKDFVSHYKNSGGKKIGNKLLVILRNLIMYVFLIGTLLFILIPGIYMLSEGDKTGLGMIGIIVMLVVWAVYISIKNKSNKKGE